MKTIEEVNEWLEEQYDEAHDELLACCKSGAKSTVEDVVARVAKMQFIDDIQKWMED